MTGLLRGLAVAACLALAAPAWGAGKPPPASPAGGVKEAQRLIAARRFDEALALLRPLVRGRPAAANALFLAGLAAIGVSQARGVAEDRRGALLDEAIRIFRAMLVRRPELVRVRLELARAFFLKEEDSLARRHFERVLAGEPPAAVALNVNRFLNIMRARKRWSLSVGASLLPDTNIGSGSEERIIHIETPFGRLPFRRDADELTTSGIGVSAWIGGEYQHPLGERWRLRMGGNLARRDYRTSAFDRTTLAAHLGPRWLIGRASEASLLLSGLHEWTGSGLDEPSHRDIGLRVEGRHRLNRRTTLNARAARHERRHDENTHLDGPVTDVTLGARWVASPTVRIDASVAWGRERPETESRRQTSRRARLGATALLPWGFTLGGSGALRWTDWEGDWYPFTEAGQSRRDLTRTIRLFAHNRALTLEGFSPQISVTQELRTSNAQLQDYDRLFGELRFVRLF